MKNKSYRHWLIVILMCCLSASSIGLCTNSVGVFYIPVSESLGVLKGTFALHATLSSLATAMTSLFMSRVMRRYHYKKIMIFGILLATGSTVFMAFSDSIWLFYILGILRGIGAGIYGMVPLTVIISNWFVEKHGLATSIALSFSGLSGAVFSPLLSSWIISYGWQRAYLLMAVCIFALTVPAAAVNWSTHPQHMQLLPYGYKKTETVQQMVQKTKISFLSLSFLCLCFMTVFHTSITGISQHLSGMAASIELSATIGAAMMSLTMFGNIATKLLIGMISDLLNPVKACIIMIFVNIISLCFLWQGMLTGNITVLLASSFAFGSIYSVGAVGIPLLTRYFFGNENYLSTYSVIGFLTNVGSSSSLTLIGYAYDFTGGYTIVIVMALIFHVVNLIFLMIICLRYKKDMMKMKGEC